MPPFALYAARAGLAMQSTQLIRVGLLHGADSGWIKRAMDNRYTVDITEIRGELA